MFHPRDKNGNILASSKLHEKLDTREYFDQQMRKQGHYENWELDKAWQEYEVGVGKIVEKLRAAIINPGDRMRMVNPNGANNG